MSHLWKKVNVACFNSCPMKCSSSDCYGSSDSLLHARLPACHETLRHKDARHSHANRISTLSDKMRLFSAIEIIPGERSCCVSAVLKSILHFCTSKKKKRKKIHDIIGREVNCLFSPTGLRACSLFTLFIPPPALNVFFCARRYELSAGL